MGTQSHSALVLLSSTVIAIVVILSVSVLDAMGKLDSNVVAVVFGAVVGHAGAIAARKPTGTNN